MAAEPRLATEFWVRAYLVRLRLADIPVFVRAHGDDTAGAVLIKLNTLDGKARAFQGGYDAEGGRIWAVLAEGADADVEAALHRQMGYDPDLWVLELEDAAGRTLLDEPGLTR